MKESKRRKFFVFFCAIALLWICHHFILRPLFLDWGATDEIKALPLAGDKFTNGERHSRAVLINARPEEIWPWIIQIGQERGGFYSHEWLENLFLADMKNVYAIDRRLQGPRHKGDTVWLADKKRYNGAGYQIIAEVTPPESYVMVGGADYARIESGMYASGSWALYLHPQSELRYMVYSKVFRR